VHEVADDVPGAVARIVSDVLQSGPDAVRAAKRLTLGDTAEGLELARIAAGLRAGGEGQEGLRAFLEKRDPNWRR
jgi:methylglutaconyl-CoA hydratase